jgi:hypothetical protein
VLVITYASTAIIARFDGGGLDTWLKTPPAQYDKDEILEKLQLLHKSDRDIR